MKGDDVTTIMKIDIKKSE